MGYTGRSLLAAGLVAGSLAVPASAQGGTATLRIGALLPKPGSLAFLGPSSIAGV